MNLLIWLALQTGADVQIVHTGGPEPEAALKKGPGVGEEPACSGPEIALDEFDGVGALLRYA